MSEVSTASWVVATSIITICVVFWAWDPLIECIHDARTRRENREARRVVRLERQAARLEAQALRFALLASQCGDAGYKKLQFENNESYRFWACRARQVEVRLRAMKERRN